MKLKENKAEVNKKSGLIDKSLYHNDLLKNNTKLFKIELSHLTKIQVVKVLAEVTAAGVGVTVTAKH